MTVEKFSKRFLSTNIINTYVATVFFATVIYFIININIYTPVEMLTWVIFCTIASKGIATLMVSLVIYLFDTKKMQEKIEYQNSITNINNLINELSVQQAKIKANRE